MQREFGSLQAQVSLRTCLDTFPIGCSGIGKVYADCTSLATSRCDEYISLRGRRVMQPCAVGNQDSLSVFKGCFRPPTCGKLRNLVKAHSACLKCPRLFCVQRNVMYSYDGPVAFEGPSVLLYRQTSVLRLCLA